MGATGLTDNSVRRTELDSDESYFVTGIFSRIMCFGEEKTLHKVIHVSVESSFKWFP